MTPEQIERNREFMKVLRDGSPKAVHKMRDNVGGRCCLCKALDCAAEMGFNRSGETVIMPPDTMAEWYGWPNKNPKLHHREDYVEGGIPASELNDGNPENKWKGMTHDQIADAFEETFPEIKVS